MALASTGSYYKLFLKGEASFILFLQNVLDEDNMFFLRLSKYCETSYAIGILFPVFASLDTKLGFQVLLVSSFSEWGSTLLKWILAEPRPYWWVQEEKLNIPLRQSELTCETGPGSPSGHVMCCAALQYVFLHWLIVWCNESFTNEWAKYKNPILGFFWIVYISLIVLIAVARVNIAAHFPHQCIFGATLGYLLANFLIDDPEWGVSHGLLKLPKTKMFALAVFFSLLSGCVYGAHLLLGYDPGWSIKLAFKWCRRPDTVSVYTTPIYCLVRDAGCFIGLGLASPIKERKFYPIVGAIVTTLFFVSTRLLKPMMPNNDPFQFYLFHFLDNTFISVCLLTVIPYIASLVKLKEKVN
ncbi:glucose-6-phosphatase 3 [Cimex lectularius]|uniref:Glucose-6-phosphatase n=1 Tax=Cimex lectularius TaxID=79782 RepID=A0A8I6RGH7_CIMLE|nr:glucose-6-phosphatase 3 [Cimex lectularius]